MLKVRVGVSVLPSGPFETLKSRPPRETSTYQPSHPEIMFVCVFSFAFHRPDGAQISDTGFWKTIKEKDCFFSTSFFFCLVVFFF